MKLLLYKSYVVPIMTYGSVVWGTMSIHQLRRLQVIQNKVLKYSILNAPYYVRNDRIHNELRIRPVLPAIKRLAYKFYKNIPSIPNPILHNLPPYHPGVASSAKRPRALLHRPDIALPPSKKRRQDIVAYD